MNDDLDEDTQWTAAAREAYSARGEELLNAVRDHVADTVTRTGRQAEHPQHSLSAGRLRAAAMAFDDAEFDWCGSSAFGLDADLGTTMTRLTTRTTSKAATSSPSSDDGITSWSMKPR